MYHFRILLSMLTCDSVQPLQPGVRLTAIFDSCHSGSALDLPYIYSTQGVLKEPNLAKEAGQGLLGIVSSYARGDMGGMASTAMGFLKKATVGDSTYQKNIRTKTSPADVIMWSGSKDTQTSYVPNSYFRRPHVPRILPRPPGFPHVQAPPQHQALLPLPVIPESQTFPQPHFVSQPQVIPQSQYSSFSQDIPQSRLLPQIQSMTFPFDGGGGLPQESDPSLHRTTTS